mmetsp:Transcript_7920/g.20708  ORF Transcript_7920/g.20708 Transcript_7920/m.20708 type:complete len:266 (+) Transcript_7920:2-799(+)
MTAALKRVTPFLFKGGVLGHVTLTAASPWLALADAPLTLQGVSFADERSKQPTLAALLRSGKAPNGISQPVALAAVSPSAADSASCSAAATVGGVGAAAAPNAVTAAASARATVAPRSVLPPCLSVVLVASRRHCEMVEYFLQAEGFGVVTLAGERPKRAERDAVLSKLSTGSVRVLVATDAALSSISDELGPVGHVISFDFPSSMVEYTQRLAHTGRGGHSGRKTTIVTDAVPRMQVAALANMLQRSNNQVPRWLEWMAIKGAA